MKLHLPSLTHAKRAPGPRMPHFHLLGETHNSFHVRSGGKEFHIAKGLLSPAFHQLIRTNAQHLDGGGLATMGDPGQQSLLGALGPTTYAPPVVAPDQTNPSLQLPAALDNPLQALSGRQSGNVFQPGVLTGGTLKSPLALPPDAKKKGGPPKPIAGPTFTPITNIPDYDAQIASRAMAASAPPITFSKGGVVPKFQLLKEDAHSFHVSSGDKQFQIAKHMIHPALQDAIRKHGVAPFEVQHYDDGTADVEGADPTGAPDLGALTPAQAAQIETNLGATATDPSAFGAMGSQPPMSDSDASGMTLGGIGSRMAGGAMNWLTSDPAGQPGISPFVSEQAPVAAAADQPVGSAVAPAAVPAQAQQAGRAPPSTPAVAASPAGALPPVPPAPDFTASYKAADAALVAQQQATSAAAQREGTAQDAANKLLAEGQQNYQQQLQANQSRVKSLSDAVENGQIVNPWHSLSTGQKVMTTIGLALGAGGAALSHSANFAGQVFDQIMNQDLEAQRADLGRKQTLLGTYMQQGHDLQTSWALAKSDLQASLAGQLARSAATEKDANAKAALLQGQAQYQANALKTTNDYATQRYQNLVQRVQLGSTLATQGMQRQLQGQQIQEGVLDLEQRKNVMAMLQGLAQQSAGAPGGQPGQPAESPWGGMRISGAMLNSPYFPKDLRDSAVALPDGTYGFAKGGPKAKDDLDTVITSASELQRTLNEMRNFMQGGVGTGTAYPLTTRGDVATSLRARAVAQLDGMILPNGRGLPESVGENLKQQVPDPGAFRQDAAKARLDELQRTIDQTVQAHVRQAIGLSFQPGGTLAPPTGR